MKQTNNIKWFIEIANQEYKGNTKILMANIKANNKIRGDN